MCLVHCGKMISGVLTCVLVFFLTLFVNTDAFWWRATTTTESPTVLRHIPLTYFRTYTYQPLTGSPFAFPYFGSGGFGAPSQKPIIAGARSDNYDGSVSVNKQIKTTITMPITTTTTTTTPAPTSTSSTTTTAASQTLPHPIEPLLNAVPQFMGDYPNYDRRIYTNGPNFYRPRYQYPEYYPYPTANKGSYGIGARRSSPVQFVPCMCPVNVGMSSEIQLEDQYNTAYFPQARSTADEGPDMELPLESESSISKVIIEPISERERLINADNAASAIVEEDQLTNNLDTDFYGTASGDLQTKSEQI